MNFFAKIDFQFSDRARATANPSLRRRAAHRGANILGAAMTSEVRSALTA
jgi:hypothetical protein